MPSFPAMMTSTLACVNYCNNRLNDANTYQLIYSFCSKSHIVIGECHSSIFTDVCWSNKSEANTIVTYDCPGNTDFLCFIS